MDQSVINQANSRRMELLRKFHVHFPLEKPSLFKLAASEEVQIRFGQLLIAWGKKLLKESNKSDQRFHQKALTHSQI